MMGAVLILAALALFAYGAYELAPRSPRAMPARTALGGRRGYAAAAGGAAAGQWAVARAVPAERTIAVLGALGVVCWLILLPWYSLGGHYAVPDFAFDKIPGHFASATLQVSTLLFLLLALLYLGMYAVLRATPRLSTTLKVLLVVFVAIVAAVNLGLYPVGALDVYNYGLWLQEAFSFHQNPYLAASQTHLAADPFAIFGWALPYGPSWTLLSWLPTALTGFADPQRTVLGLKVFNTLLLGLTTLAIYRYQEDDRRGWLAAFLFLANPLILFEGIANGHNDVYTAVFLVAALLMLKRRSALVGPLLMLSVLVKFFTGVLIPLFVLAAIKQRWPRQKIALAALGGAAVTAIGFAPFWSGGTVVGGLLQAMGASQQMSSVSISSLVREYLGLAGAPAGALTAAHAILAVVCAAAIVYILWLTQRGRDLETALVATYLSFSVLITLVEPWYLIPAFALLALRRDPLGLAYVAAATVLGLIYNTLSVWAWFNSGMDAFHIHLFQALFLTVPMLIYLGLVLRPAAQGYATAQKILR